MENRSKYIERISLYDRIEILINGKIEMQFEGIIDAPYIVLHFERILKEARHFDIVTLMGFDGTKNKQVIVEVIVEKDTSDL